MKRKVIISILCMLTSVLTVFAQKSVSSGPQKGNYYFKSSRTGMVCFLNIHFPEAKAGGGMTANGAGGLFTYVGRENGRDKWTTYTIRLLQDAKRNPYTGQTFYVYNGKSERVPTKEGAIFTEPDMSAVYTINDTFDIRISSDEWSTAKDEGRNYTGPGSVTGVNPSYDFGGGTQNGGTGRQRSNTSGYAQCRHCHGSGRCSTCNGTGDRGDTHNYEKNKVVWRCTTCSGSGKCMFCNGTGRIRN